MHKSNEPSHNISFTFNFLKNMNTNLFCYVSLLSNLIYGSSCGLVAYSTELDRRDNLLYSFPLESYQDIWKSMFFWSFFSIFIVHILASIIATATLRKHKYGR